uniref:Putative ankyrin repeat protein n=1 Tax=Lutzomyia longipalpis TaxID=7200 RepID=A0A1B0C9Y2_LUTLO
MGKKYQISIPNDYLREIVYQSAKDGMNILLYGHLQRIHPAEMRNIIINQGGDAGEPKTLSPFMVAAYHGHACVLKMLLERFKPDLENECPLNYDGTLIEGVTALWCAAGAGHLECVKVLVRAGADVNHWTKSHSTPVRAACYLGRMDIVKYLMAHGAQIDLPNIYNNTCLMIAAHRGHLDVVEFLMKEGMDINTQARCGATALHYAAESGHMEICELLLSRGAIITKNDYAHSTTVSVFLEFPDLMTKPEKIEALELLGASVAANEKDAQSLPKAHTYLMAAMEMRHDDPDTVLRKTLEPPIAAYDNWVECQTVAEMQAIRHNANSIYMEALAVRERILGRKFPDLVSPVVYHGAVCADHGRFDRCENLWHHALFLRQSNGYPVARDLQRFAQLFAQMFTIRYPLRLPSLITILSSCVVEMARTTKKMNAITVKEGSEEMIEEVDSNIISTLYIICLITKLMKSRKPVDPEDLKQIYKLVKEVVFLHMRLRDGQTILHLACNAALPLDEFRTRDLLGRPIMHVFFSFPCPDTVKLLLHCGANPNDVDFDGNNTLHVLIKDPPPRHVIVTLEYVLNRLIRAGAHVDAVNDQGFTPRQSTQIKAVQNIVRSYEVREMKLACLAAQRVARSKIEFEEMVPKHLETFIEMHSPKFDINSTNHTHTRTHG